MYKEEEKLNILECVKVIQGEGRSTGVPMILIRVSGCNLNCAWKGSICDASETSWLHNNKTAKKWSLGEIREVLKNNSLIKTVMLTGGEPTLNQKLFKSIVRVCREEDKKVEVESNGTIFIEDLDDEINLMSISPKLENSIPQVGIFVKELGREIEQKEVDLHLRNNNCIESIKKWMKYTDYQLKFVISEERDLEEVLSFVEEVKAPLDKVYFMPEGMTRVQLESKRKWLYEKCLELGVNYTDRLHILVYDDKKGV